MVLFTHLKNDGLVAVLEIECEHIGVHKSLSTLTQHFDSLAKELNLYPRHVSLLHSLHLSLDVVDELSTNVGGRLMVDAIGWIIGVRN